MAQDQTEYRRRYEEIAARYKATEARLAGVAEEINALEARRRKAARFIRNLEGLPGLFTEFDEGLWAALVDRLVVHGEGRATWKLTSGMELDT